jgi:hypothetical protein
MSPASAANAELCARCGTMGTVAGTVKQSIRMPHERYGRVQARAGQGQAAGVINALCEAYADGDPAALRLVAKWLPKVRSAGQAEQAPAPVTG